MSDFTEAPVSFNVKIISPDGFDCMLTVRGSEGKELMPQALDALKWLKEKGFKPTRVVYTGHGAPAVPPQPAGVVAPGATPNGVPAAGSARCDQMTVGTSKNGKLQLQFDTDIGKLRATLPIDRLVGLLPDGWTAAHLVDGKVYTISFLIQWEQAGQYKNVKRIDNV